MFYDIQQMSPAGWCPECGGEIYAMGHNLCSKCEKTNDDEEVYFDD